MGLLVGIILKKGFVMSTQVSYQAPQKHIKKKWPYYRELIDELKKNFKNYEVAIAPGYGEVEDSRKFNAHIILDKIIQRTEITL